LLFKKVKKKCFLFEGEIMSYNSPEHCFFSFKTQTQNTDLKLLAQGLEELARELKKDIEKIKSDLQSIISNQRYFSGRS